VDDEDQEVANALVSLVMRRRVAGYTPVLIVSASEHDGAVSDTILEPEALQALLEWLLAAPVEPLHEPMDQ
jgi:hypothetical protein